jgi:peptidoglycan/LPS O-acetylase OafA/YrhL
MSPLQPHFPLSRYRADIDGLRAVAILSVVAFHAFPSWVPGGFIGVDVFFVISGYLISDIILKDLDEGTFGFVAFYARRIRRVFPALILVLVASYAFAWFALLANEFKQLGTHIAGAASFVSNFVLWHESGYFDNSAETKPLLHLWSLGIEEQFYLVWPMFLWIAWTLRLHLPALMILVAIVSLSLNIRGAENDAISAFFSPQTRFWELLCGSLLAWMRRYDVGTLASVEARIGSWWPLSRSAPSHAISLTGFVLLTCGFWYISKASNYPGKWAIVPVLGAVLIISAGPQAWLNRALLSHRISVWFGLISYPLYLWHWPILSFLQIIGDETPAPDVRIAAVALSIVLAWMTFKLLEQPIRSRINPGRSALYLVVAMVVVGISGFSYKTDIYDNSWKGSQRFILSKSAVASPKRAECHVPQDERFASRKICEYPEGTKIEVAVLGNSHGVELAFALSQGLSKHGVGLRQLTMSGCPVSYKLHIERGGRNSVCIKWHEFAVNNIIGSKGIKVVVLSYRMENYAWQRVYQESMYELVHDLANSGKRVILVLQAPMLDRGINYYIRRAFWRDRVASKPLSAWKEQYKAGYLIANEVKNKASVVDPSEVMCDDEECYAIRDNKSLFFNKDHMSVDGALLVSTKLLPVVMRQLYEQE